MMGEHPGVTVVPGVVQQLVQQQRMHIREINDMRALPVHYLYTTPSWGQRGRFWTGPEPHVCHRSRWPPYHHYHHYYHYYHYYYHTTNRGLVGAKPRGHASLCSLVVPSELLRRMDIMCRDRLVGSSWRLMLLEPELRSDRRDRRRWRESAGEVGTAILQVRLID